MKQTSHARHPETPPDSAELRKFGLIFGSLVIVAFGLLVPWLWGLEISLSKWPWPVGAVFITWSLVHPSSLGPVYRIWMKFGHAIGWVNTRLILGLAFYFVIMPTGLLMRLVFRKDPMHRRFEADAQTYRINAEKSATNTMEKPF
jgi:hypothetical protein